MTFYQLNKDDRNQLVQKIYADILSDLKSKNTQSILPYFSDEDTYIRKTAYLSIGKLFLQQPHLQKQIIEQLDILLQHEDFHVRQTTVNAAGEIGKHNFESVQYIFDTALFDQHHAPRNAVIGSIKKMGEVNPTPILSWAQQYLHHPNKEIRREICHGIELRGRKYPQDILSLLQQLENDPTKRVSKTLVHVLGQISYKKGCLQTVVEHLKTWQNKVLVEAALEEIIDVHERYKNFAVLTQEQAIEYIHKNYR